MRAALGAREFMRSCSQAEWARCSLLSPGWPGEERRAVNDSANGRMAAAHTVLFLLAASVGFGLAGLSRRYTCARHVCECLGQNLSLLLLATLSVDLCGGTLGWVGQSSAPSSPFAWKISDLSPGRNTWPQGALIYIRSLNSPRLKYHIYESWPALAGPVTRPMSNRSTHRPHRQPAR